MSDLAEYARKRDFTRTPEPSPSDGSPGEGRRFVVQKHAARRLHFDLRLEVEGTLRSWAVPKGPSLDPEVRTLAVQVEDHPLDYGSFEGTIPKGEYGGGTMMLWDRGKWLPGRAPGEKVDPRDALERGRLHFRLEGERLRGAWLLVRMGGRAGEDGRNWLLRKADDAEARPGDGAGVTEEHLTSLVTGRTMEGIAAAGDPVAGPPPPPPSGAPKAGLPSRLEPQLPTLVKGAPKGDRWVHELKFDGYRIQARLEANEVTLVTRGGHDWTDRFPGVAAALGELGVDDTLLDGEIAVPAPDGTTDFQALQSRLSRGRADDVTYFLFDLPFYRGRDLRRLPLLDRKRVLKALLDAGPAVDPLRFSDHIVGEGEAVARHACLHALEGVVSKRVDAPYREGRTRDWVKVKCLRRGRFLVGGWTEPSGSRSGFGALLVGSRDDEGRLVYRGRVGTGFSAQALAELRDRLDQFPASDTPFHDPPTGAAARGVHWVRPELVADVTFAGWTDEGILRHATFRGVEAVSGPNPGKQKKSNRIAGVALSNADRVLYPEQGLTKRDLALYYEAVAAWILPHVKGRPLSLVRCPQGREKHCFYQKHLTEGMPEALRGIEVSEPGDLYVAADDLAGLVSLVQFGVLELHPWGSREDRLDRPDRIIFDLDPGDGVTWSEVRSAAVHLREILADLGLESFLRTTGGKGLHLVLPIVRRSTWDEVRGFSQDLARRMEREAKDRFVSSSSKAKRKGRIFVDYLRNGRGATAIASYSTRARPGAPVATPLRWDELDGLESPSAFTVQTVPSRLERLEADPWEGFFGHRQVLTVGMRAQAKG
ncbi:MAG: DNA ligase D [Gemmatimonadales bacterium]|nr:MAG: DNA ligase D [Gemmatimonadales bacterium]